MICLVIVAAIVKNSNVNIDIIEVKKGNIPSNSSSGCSDCGNGHTHAPTIAHYPSGAHSKSGSSSSRSKKGSISSKGGTYSPDSPPTKRPSTTPIIVHYPSPYPTTIMPYPFDSGRSNKSPDPTLHPTKFITTNPTLNLNTNHPSISDASVDYTPDETQAPLTSQPSSKPLIPPTPQPSSKPLNTPTPQPSSKPFISPTLQPSNKPLIPPTRQPSSKPTLSPTTLIPTVLQPNDDDNSYYYGYDPTATWYPTSTRYPFYNRKK